MKNYVSFLSNYVLTIQINFRTISFGCTSETNVIFHMNVENFKLDASILEVK